MSSVPKCPECGYVGDGFTDLVISEVWEGDTLLVPDWEGDLHVLECPQCGHFSEGG